MKNEPLKSFTRYHKYNKVQLLPAIPKGFASG